MADDPSRGQPGFEPLPGWPRPPEDVGPKAAGAPPPSAPPPGWTGPPPAWAEPPPRPSVIPPPPQSPPPPVRRRLDGLRSRRGLAIGAGVVVLLLVVAIAAVVLSSGGGDGGRGDATGQGSRGSAPAAAVGKDLPVLEGRMVVAVPEGWEILEAGPDLASIRVNLREGTGRELIGTLIVTALPGGGSFDALLKAPGGTPFEVTTSSGPIQAAAMGDKGHVQAGAARPSGRYLLSLSVFALDGKGLDAALLQKLFTEQVAPQLRFP